MADWALIKAEADARIEKNPENFDALYKSAEASYYLGDAVTSQDKMVELGELADKKKRADWNARAQAFWEKAKAQVKKERDAARAASRPCANEYWPQPKPFVPAPELEPGSVARQWHQSNNRIVLTMLQKGLQEADVEVNLAPKEIKVKFPLKEGGTYEDTIVPRHPINPEGSQVRVTKYKVEVTLAKEDPSISNWATYEEGEVVEEESTDGPVTPYNSGTDWGQRSCAIHKELEKEPEEPLGGLAGVYQSVNDDDAKRAMMKSFIESGGTVLNMDWSKCADKKVEPYNPDAEPFE